MRLLIAAKIACVMLFADLQATEKINFDLHWKFIQEDIKGAEKINFDVKEWRTLNLPHDWSIEGEYKETENGTDWQSGYLPAGVGGTGNIRHG